MSSFASRLWRASPRLEAILSVVLCIPLCSSMVRAEGVTAEPAEKPQEIDYEAPPVVDVKAMVAPEMLKDANYTLSDEAEFNGFFCRFHLHSDRVGNWDPSSMDQLNIRTHEMDILATYSDGPKENGFGKGAVDKFKDTGKAIKDTVVTPVATFKAIGTGVSDTTMNVIDFIRRKDRHQPKDALLLGEQKRKLAAQWGVDVYTSNIAMQDLLIQKCRSRFAGNALISVSLSVGTSFLTPVSLALSAVQYRENVNAQLNTLSAKELYWYNDRILKKMDVSSSDREAFLISEDLSPRQKTEIIADMVTLAQVSDKPGFLKMLIEKRPGDGVWQVQAVDMLAKFYNAKDPLYKFQSRGMALCSRTTGGKNIVAIPSDILFWSKDVAQVFADVEKAQPGPGVCLVTGQMTPRARQELEKMGYTVREHFLVEEKPPVQVEGPAKP